MVVHRRELVRQAIDTLAEAVPHVEVGVEAAGWPSKPWAPLQVGSVQSMVRRDWLADLDFDIVIFDEVHHARATTWEKVMAFFPDAKRIGLTATPQRLDGRGLGEHFDAMISGPEIPELVRLGFLAPTRTLSVPVGFNLEALRKDSHGEFRQSDVYEQVTGPITAAAADAYLTHCRGKKAIFFGVHREHSRQVARELRERGVRAEHVDGDDTPERRDRVMKAFKTGKIEVVCNVDLISEGFDAPACEAVLIGAPTSSVVRFLQQAGRAMRPGPGKTALAVDLVGVVHNLGLPDDIREWSLEDGEIKPLSEKKRPKTCRQCETAHYGRECPTCGYAAPLLQVEQVVVKLEDAKAQRAPKPRRRRDDLWGEIDAAKASQDPLGALRKIRVAHGLPPSWPGYIHADMGNLRLGGR